MTLELFPDDAWRDARQRMADAFDRWIDARVGAARRARSARALRPDSVEVYRDMWGRFADWCVRHELAFESIGADDLASFVDSLGRRDAVTARYARRMLRLIDRIDAHDAVALGRPRNRAVAALLARPRFRGADAFDDPLPAFLTAAETRRLIERLTGKDPDTAPRGWQDVRNRTAVALQLGAGLTPGEARSLRLESVIHRDGPGRGVPWALSLPANGNFPARQTPLARWAARPLSAWLAMRERLGVPGPMVFPSTRAGTPWSKAGATLAFRAVLEQAGVAEPSGGSFRLRHTFALRQLTRHPPDAVARWLGVQDPSAIDRYRRVLVRPVDVV